MGCPLQVPPNGSSVGLIPIYYHLNGSLRSSEFLDFVLAKVTPDLVTDLGYKIFLMFATINVAGMGVFSL